MQPFAPLVTPFHRRLARLGLTAGASLLGLALAAGLLLAVARPASAAVASTTLTYPGLNPCDSTLQACIDGAADGDTILISAGSYTESFNLNKPISLTGVASNTVILWAEPGQRVMTMTNNAGFLPGIVISGLTFAGGDATTGLYPANCGGGLFFGVNNTPLLANLIITGNTAGVGGGLCSDNFADLRLVNSLVLSNAATAGDGGGMRLIGAAAITGSLFQDNECLASSCFGGGLLFFFQTLTLSNTRFLSNTAQGAGGGAYAYGPAVVNGGLFAHNQCSNLGGCDGGALNTQDTLNLTGTQFISNVAHFRGGALFANQTAVLVDALFQDNACLQGSICLGGGLVSIFGITLSGTNFLSNTAVWRGGGVYADGPAVLLGGLFQHNTCSDADCLAGGLLASDDIALTGTTFLSNISGSEGGGLYAASAVTLTDGLFQTNTCTKAGCQGGGFFGNGGLTLTGTRFLSNTAPGGGGGAVNIGAAALTNGLFQNNSCSGSTCWGGGLLAATSASLTGTTFLSNTAQQRGGGAYVNNAAVLAGGVFRSNQCAAADCEGGGLYASGTLALAGTDFVGNTARSTGGGAYASGAATLAGGLFQANACVQTNCRGGGLFVFNNIPLTLTSMTFLSNTALAQGGGVDGEAGITVTGGLFRGNTCTQADCQGGGLYAGNTLALTGTTFMSNSSLSLGAGARVLGAAALTNGLFQGNACSQALCKGGGLHAGGSLALTGTQFLSNTTRSNGGGVFAGGAVTLNGGVFQGNACAVAGCQGGGLYVTFGLTSTNADFIANSAHSDGGGLYAGGAARLSAARFERNACSDDNCQGGGLYALNDLSLTGATFDTNTARFSGGGATANAGGAAVITGGLFQGNACTQAACRGGGLNVNGSLALTATAFIANHAIFDGGGLRTAGPATVDTALFQANTATQGGGFYHGGAGGRVVNTLFANNTASNAGAALYVNASAGSFNLLHDTIGMAASNNITSAVQVAAGSVGITNTLFYFHDFGIVRTGGTVFEDYNLFAQIGFTATGGVTGGAHSFRGAAGFLNPAAFDFHLTIASAAIDRGANAGISLDFEGDARPMGHGYDIGYDEAPPFSMKLYLPLLMKP